MDTFHCILFMFLVNLKCLKLMSFITFRLVSAQDFIFCFALFGTRMICLDHLYNPQLDVAFDFILFFAS